MAVHQRIPQENYKCLYGGEIPSGRFIVAWYHPLHFIGLWSGAAVAGRPADTAVSCAYHSTPDRSQSLEKCVPQSP